MTTTSPAAGRGPSAPAADLLRRADLALGSEFDEHDRLALATRHVVRCAADMLEALPTGDLEAARSALGHARGAVVAATYAVRALHGGLGEEPGP